MHNQPSIISRSPEETFELGEKLGADLVGGEAVLLTGGLGAGKTLFTKGVLNALGYDPDEVTSPSFTLVNLYETERFRVYHIDLWRAGDSEDAAFSVGLEEILENEAAVVIIEWSERLKDYSFGSVLFRIAIHGDGDEPRHIEIKRTEQIPAARV